MGRWKTLRHDTLIETAYAILAQESGMTARAIQMKLFEPGGWTRAKRFMPSPREIAAVLQNTSGIRAFGSTPLKFSLVGDEVG